MIKTMTKSLALATAIAALTAIAIPSMASAAAWSPLNTYHNLSSPSNITFNVNLGGGSPPTAISCSSGPTFGALVRTTASPIMDLTSTTANLPCTGTGLFAGCNFALGMIGLPVWNVDGTSTTNVKVNSVNIEGKVIGTPCSGSVPPFTLSGTLAGGVWSNLNRSLAFTNGTGLTWRPGGGSTYPVTVTANEFIKDTTSPFLSLL
jgi:hypothetical protein